MTQEKEKEEKNPPFWGGPVAHQGQTKSGKHAILRGKRNPRGQKRKGVYRVSSNTRERYVPPTMQGEAERGTEKQIVKSQTWFSGETSRP